jgi:hypothetical protein
MVKSTFGLSCLAILSHLSIRRLSQDAQMWHCARGLVKATTRKTTSPEVLHWELDPPLPAPDPIPVATSVVFEVLHPDVMSATTEIISQIRIDDMRSKRILRVRTPNDDGHQVALRKPFVLLHGDGLPELQLTRRTIFDVWCGDPLRG